MYIYKRDEHSTVSLYLRVLIKLCPSQCKIYRTNVSCTLQCSERSLKNEFVHVQCLKKDSVTFKSIFFSNERVHVHVFSKYQCVNFVWFISFHLYVSFERDYKIAEIVISLSFYVRACPLEFHVFYFYDS